MVNRVILVGILGRDAVVTTTNSGVSIAKFSLVTTEPAKVDGKWDSKPTWHNVVIIGKTAEYIANKGISKGETVYVEGKINNSTYEKDGVSKSKTEIVCYEFKTLKKSDKSDDKDYSDNSKDDYDMPF